MAATLTARRFKKGAGVEIVAAMNGEPAGLVVRTTVEIEAAIVALARMRAILVSPVSESPGGGRMVIDLVRL